MTTNLSAHDVAMAETLWSFVKIVSTEECLCGNPPYDNGNPCNACFALGLLELRQHDRRIEQRKVEDLG